MSYCLATPAESDFLGGWEGGEGFLGVIEGCRVTRTSEETKSETAVLSVKQRIHFTRLTLKG